MKLLRCYQSANLGEKMKHGMPGKRKVDQQVAQFIRGSKPERKLEGEYKSVKQMNNTRESSK
jgi:hypothetical protein